MIRKRREASGLTVRELGKIIGVSGAAISKWESGGNMSWENRIALSDALGISVTDFLPGGDFIREITAQTPQEKLLLQRFRELPAALRAAYLNMLILQAEQQQPPAPKKRRKR